MIFIPERTRIVKSDQSEDADPFSLTAVLTDNYNLNHIYIKVLGLTCYRSWSNKPFNGTWGKP